MDYLLLNQDTLLNNHSLYTLNEPDSDQTNQTFSSKVQRDTFLAGHITLQPGPDIFQQALVGAGQGLLEAQRAKLEEYRQRIRAAYATGNTTSLPELKRDFLRLGGETDFDPTKPQPDNQSSKGQERLSLLREKKSLSTEYIMGKHNGKQYILDENGNLVVEVSDTHTSLIDDKPIEIARVTNSTDFTGATLPDTNILLVGDKVFRSLLHPTEELQKGYRTHESVRMILGHELTHVKFHTMPPEERNQILAYYASQWGNLYEFATTLLSREDYRKVILSQTAKALASNSNTETRPITIEGKRIEIALEGIVDELIAYNSSNELFGQQRMKELAAINPTGEQIHRELLSIKAGEALAKMRRTNQTLPGESLYQNLPDHVNQVFSSLAKMAQKG